jgi:iron complex outermembrane receptor protein
VKTDTPRTETSITKHLLVALTACLWTTSSLLTALPALAGAVSGQVLDSRDGSPIADATVALSPLGRSTLAGAGGEFELADVPDGNYELRVSATGFQDLSQRITLPSTDATAMEILLAPNISFVDEIVVTPNRSSTPLRETSQSVGVVAGEVITSTKMVGLDEVLNTIPGVKAEAQNATDQVRISIRGRGVRTSFGTRGIRILVDGIPEGDATGETSELSGLGLTMLRRIEVVKGPMSSQYGASPSGVINLLTENSAAVPTVEARVLGGSFGFLKGQLQASGTTRALSYLFNFDEARLDGYRDHSDLDDQRLYGRVGIPLGNDGNLTLSARVTDVDVLLPGGLTADELAQDRDQASFFFLLFDARQELDREVFSARYDKLLGADSELSAMAFSRSLEFVVPVPFIFLTGQRDSLGGNLRFSTVRQAGNAEHTLTFGGDIQGDELDAVDFENVAGIPGQARFRDETEDDDSLNLFVMDEIRLSDRFGLRLGVAYSELDVAVRDKLQFFGDLSGSTSFDDVSFRVGAVFQPNPKASLYLNLSTGFEPPTSSEITRGETGAGGINQLLKPQESTNYEIGGRFTVSDKVFLDLAAFHLEIQNEILPTGTGFPQGTFNNAGDTTHDGFEALLGVDVSKSVDLRVGYTFSDFTFDRFVNANGDFSGNDIPGIPPHRLEMSLNYRHESGFLGGLDWRWVDEFFAEDSNSVVNDSLQSTNLRLGYQHTAERVRVSILAGVNNVFDEDYVDYVVINDNFGGYFYPSPGRNYLGNVSVSWSF